MANIFMKFLIFLPVVIFFITSCASQKDIIYLNSQLNALYRQTKKEGKRVEKSIRELEEAIKANEAKHKKIERVLKDDQESIRLIRLSLARLGADFAEIKDNIQGLTGRVEEGTYLLKRTVEEDTTEEDALVSQMRKLSLMAEDLKSRIESIENYVSFEITHNKKKAGSEKASPDQDIGKRDSPPPEKKELTESEIYERTMVYYKDGRYGEAIAGFQDFVRLYPRSDLADNAYFWIGECHRVVGKYEEAILAFQRVINDYPKGNKVPSAMLHQAIAFEKINDKITANLVFKKLLKGFPKTKEAEIARKRLSKK
jgi:tol-pal system protein YbgF